MNVEAARKTFASASQATEHFDVLIVGAGISGIGSAYQLDQADAGHELRDPGNAGDVRRHLVDAQISGHPLRLRSPYLRLQLQAVGRAADRDRRRNPRLYERGDRGERSRQTHPLQASHPAASWSSETNLWTIEAEKTDSGEARDHSPRISSGCARAITAIPRATRPNGRAWSDFKGRIVHPQTWPDDLDLDGKQVVVIGSGATAATLIPNIADECAHVTMLQRSPTYFRLGRNAIEHRRGAAAAAGQGRMDPRDRPAQDPVRAGCVHQAAASPSPSR